MRKKRKMFFAAITAILMTMQTVVAPIGGGGYMTAWADPAADALNTAILLLRTDLETNRTTIGILIDNAMTSADPSSPGVQMLQNTKDLLNAGSTDVGAMEAYLQAAAALLSDAGTGGTQPAPQPETQPAPQPETQPAPQPETQPAPQPETQPTPQPETQPAPQPETQPAPQPETQPAPQPETEFHRENTSSLPEYVAEGYVTKELTKKVQINVPKGWGNNASERALTSYSPVNKSGAINPGAGTLTTTHFEKGPEEDKAACASYEKSISAMSVTANLTSMEARAAGLPASRIRYTMNIGSNRFDCEVICFAYEENVYAVELMQGSKSKYDYFHVFDEVVDSIRVGDNLPPVPETEPEPQREIGQPEPQPEIGQPQPQPQPQSAPQPETAVVTGDLADFNYAINGHQYPFPTSVSAIISGDLPIDMSAVVPYQFKPDTDIGGLWTEIANTEYFCFENTLYKEMAGITNMSGADQPASQGTVTALIDTQGDQLRVTLPGGITIGSPESAILNAFPEFASIPKDGTAGFRGNEILYACNTRSDGSFGYVLIRNDAPYYSTLSIICENAQVVEISFECIGGRRAGGIFL